MKVPLENIRCAKLAENFYVEKVRFKNGFWIGKSESRAKQISGNLINWAFFDSTNKLVMEADHKDFKKKFKKFRNKYGGWSWVK